jgi:hypothetical protein
MTDFAEEAQNQWVANRVSEGADDAAAGSTAQNQQVADRASEGADDAAAGSTAEDQRVANRAALLPEERAAGSEEPQAQARIILEDSDERTENPQRGAEESPQVADR